MADFTEKQVIALKYTPLVSGIISILSSLLLVKTICCINRTRRTLYEKLILCMSIMDVFGSLAFCLANSMVPKPDGLGNQYTCSLQGFVLQVNLAVPFWNTALALNFLLRIRYDWKELDLQQKVVWFHVAVWTWPVVTAFIALGLNQYHNSGKWCWIAKPKDCEAGALCSYAPVFQMVLFYVPLWILMGSVCVFMMLIVRFVSKKQGTTNIIALATYKSKISLITRQAVLYAGAFILTWIFGTLNRVQQLFGPPIFLLVFLHVLFVPLQGFLNAIVYFHPKWLSKRCWNVEANVSVMKSKTIPQTNNKEQRRKYSIVRM